MSDSDERCTYAVSCTTREPRPGEVDGQHYHFLSDEAFAAKVEAGEFLEHAQVHAHCYGTLKTSVLEEIEAGKDVLLDIDVQGAAQIRQLEESWIRDALVTVFILVRDRRELESRLEGRGTESEDNLALRMTNAIEEMRHWPDYDYALVSGTPDHDRQRFLEILEAERSRSHRIDATAFDWSGEA